jgi:hypothetical protein
MIGRKRIGVVGLLALSAIGYGCAVPEASDMKPEISRNIAIPVDTQDAVRAAELWGRALYEAYASARPAEDPAVQTAIETVRKSVKDSCAPSYRAVAVMPDDAPRDRIVVYYVGDIPKSEGLMVGRHYRVETTPDGQGVLLGEPSTARCVVLPPATPGLAAMREIVHMLSPTPDEFHVFLSMIDSAGFQVVTESGRWLVEHGRIRYLGRT